MTEVRESIAVKNFAHRGYTATATENTIGAFEAALALGVDGIELDVRSCATGEVVVFHDHKIDRLTEGRGHVKNMTLHEIRQYPIRTGAGASRGEIIPTLQQVLELVAGKLALNVEIKANGLPAGHQIEQKVVDLLERFGSLQSTIISSFNPLILRRVKKVQAAAVTGLLVDRTFNLRNGEMLFTKMAGADAIHLEHTMVTPALFEKIRERGYRLLAWTVNDPAAMQELARLGIEAIITDRPSELKHILSEMIGA